VRLEDLVAVRHGDRLGPAPHTQLAENVLDVGGHGLGADEQAARDVLVTQPFA
jgi:hypothetical protein